MVDGKFYSIILYIKSLFILGNKHGPLYGNRILDQLLALLNEYVRATRLRLEKKVLSYFLTLTAHVI